MKDLKTGFRLGGLAIFVFTVSTTAWGGGAEWDNPIADDRGDFSTETISFLNLNPQPSVEFHADQLQVTDGTQQLAIEVVREDHGRLTPVPGLKFAENTTPTDDKGRTMMPGCLVGQDHKTFLTAVLQDDKISVTNGNEIYRLTVETPCAGSARLIFNQSTVGGQALGIWQIAQLAKAKLNVEVGLDFWTSPITFVWPADGNYYSYRQVHITNGDHWDVVGHELGHAIYDLGELGTFGGGMHKIDECYSTDLALSEGWASFFSAWLNVDLSDADAKFEYMVPRRAPIRFETLPLDVCRGETNEWRVIGFFWDIVDLHDDGEKMTESFARVWAAMAHSRVSSASEARARLEAAGFDRGMLQVIWNLNF